MRNVYYVPLADNSTVVKFAGGKVVNESCGVNDDRPYKYGVSLFLGNKHLLDFVTMPDEVEAMQTYSPVMAIDDLSYTMIAWNKKMRLGRVAMQFRKQEESDFRKCIIGVSDRVSDYMCNVVEEIWLYCRNAGQFNRALNLAMLNPIEGSNTYYYYPEDVTEIPVD